MNLNDIIGFIGVTIMLIPYILTLRKIITVDNLLCSVLNFIGSSLCVIYSYNIKAYPFLLIESIWALFSLYEIYNDGFSKKEKSDS